MDKMETDGSEWSGVRDAGGGDTDDGENIWGYHSYEITDFPTAIKMWNDFFKDQGKLVDDVIHTTSLNNLMRGRYKLNG